MENTGNIYILVMTYPSWPCAYSWQCVRWAMMAIILFQITDLVRSFSLVRYFCLFKHHTYQNNVLLPCNSVKDKLTEREKGQHKDTGDTVYNWEHNITSWRHLHSVEDTMNNYPHRFLKVWMPGWSNNEAECQLPSLQSCRNFLPIFLCPVSFSKWEK